jgi:hypothetical protein
MGFIDTLKKAFGLDSENDDELEVEGIDATVTPLRQRNQQLSESNASQMDVVEPDTAHSNAEVSTAVIGKNDDAVSQPDPSVIFTQVIEVFNRALPDFLGQSVDPERERQALFKALDNSMRDYFENLEKNVERRLQVKYEVDRQRLHEQIEELQVKARKEEEGTSNAKNLQLSAERQKRALSERVHDLEKQLATLSAENEQYILENKSMANKLRLASMTDRDVDELRKATAEQADAVRQKEKEIEKLIAEANAKAAEVEARLAQADSKVAEAEAKAAEAATKIAEAEARASDAENRVAAAEKRADDARQQVAAAESLLHDAAQESADRQTAAKEEASQQASKVAELQAEINRLQSALEHAKAQDDLGRAMVNDLNTRAAEARKLADEQSQQAESFKSELQQTREQLAASNAKLAKAQDDLKVVREVQAQVFQLEEKQKNSDATLRRQKDELMEKDELIRAKDADLMTKNTTLRVKDETIRRLEDQTDSLRKTIENVQYEKSQSESALLSEIERLKSIKGIPGGAKPASYPESTQVVSDNGVAVGGDLVVAEQPITTATKPEGVEPVAEPADINQQQGVELTLDLPDLMLEQPETLASKPRRGRPHKQKVEEDIPAEPKAKKKDSEDDNAFSLLDSTDWVITSTPAEHTPKPRRQRKQKAETDDDAFGYKEPIRQEPPDNPAQMLLW